MKRLISVFLLVSMLTGLLYGCKKEKTPEPVGDPVTLRIVGSWEDCAAIESLGKNFKVEYPNVTIVYEYLNNYNESLAKRLENNDEETIDIFFTTNIQKDKNEDLLPYALDLNSRTDLDLSNTFSGLVDNFKFYGTDELYAIPVGADMRGVFVNTTLLDSLKIKVPTNQATLLAACKTLKDNGYIAFHGNPGTFGQQLMYPWIANTVANAKDYETTFNNVNTQQAGISKLFEEPYEFLYTLVENYYYDYKTAQKEDGLNVFNETDDVSVSKYFLNIVDEKKVDDVGKLAFVPSAMSLINTMDKTKSDYHSNIEYVFIPTPVGENGGYAYLSPAHGIAINKNSKNLDTAVKLINFLFQPENNESFCEEFNAIPNTKDALKYITENYDVPASNICDLGQVSFDFDFYNIIVKSITDVSKANNPKYMNGTSLYPLSYYMDELEESLTAK